MGRPLYPFQCDAARVHCLQLFYNLSDLLLLWKIRCMKLNEIRRFAGLRLSDNIPDETTILNFRHFLEKHGLGKLFLKEINKHLQHQGLLFGEEHRFEDASIIPSHRAKRKIKAASATQKCVSARKATNGTLA